MGKRKWMKGWDSDWTLPMFVVIAILSIWLGLSYLPLSSWGMDFDTTLLWTYMPWILVFALGLLGVKEVLQR